MSELELIWPDPDRREAALQRISEATVGRHRNNGKHAALNRRRRGPSHRPSPHELRLVTARSYGLGLRGTADALGMNYESVKSSLRLARQRVGAKDTSHLVAICLRRGWIA